jgi:antitoxin component YwqK of YwqJK toxin-antitoxin module
MIFIINNILIIFMMSSEQKSQLEERDRKLHETCLVVQSFYRKRKREGKHKCWYRNGQICIQAHYLNYREEGRYESWHYNGRPMERAFFRDGKIEGEYKSWWCGNGSLGVYYFYRNEKVVMNFMQNNKRKILLRLKNRLLARNNLLDTFLITDLRGSCLQGAVPAPLTPRSFH